MPALSSTPLTPRSVVNELGSDDNAWSILAITGSWCFLAVLFVAMRIHARAVMVRFMGLDDIFTILTMVFGVLIWVCFVGESHYAVGKHWQAVDQEQMEMYSRWQFAHSMLLVWALYGMRLAFTLFMLRLSNSKIFRTTLFAIVGFGTLYTLASWFTILLGCTPISANWNHKPAKCISASAYTGLGLSYSVCGMVTDAILALIPVPIISGLQLNIRTKVCLLVAFGMGLATVACGAVKTYYQYSFFGNRDRLYQDNYFVWGALELYVGIIASSLVSLKPLIANFLDKAKSTLMTSAALAKSLHHASPMAQSPQLNSHKIEEKQEQEKQFNTQNFPRIEVCSVSNYSLPGKPAMNEKPKLQRHNAESPEQDSTPSFASFLVATPPKPKQKRRPAPLNTAALAKKDTLELPCMGGVLLSPSPTFLPSGTDLDFFDLIPNRDPESLQQEQENSQSRFSSSTTDTQTPPSMTTANTARSSLGLPNICGVITSPSPTFLPPGEELNFFGLIRGQDPDVVSAGNVSRRTTMISVPEDQDACFAPSRRATLSHARYASIDFSEPSSATLQTFKRIGAGEVRRRPSMAPSANSTTSAYLCPPASDNFRESQMFFHVMTSGQFRTTAETAAKTLEVEDLPLSPMSLDPYQKLVLRDQHGYTGFSPVSDGFMSPVDAASRDRVDSSDVALKKDS